MKLRELFRGSRPNQFESFEPTDPEEEVCGINDDDLLMALLAEEIVSGDVLEFTVGTTTPDRKQPIRAVLEGICQEYKSGLYFRFRPLKAKRPGERMVESDLILWRKVGHVEIDKPTSRTTPPKSS